MGKWVHRLTEVDIANKTAVCVNCGPVDIKNKGRWRCGKSVRAIANILRNKSNASHEALRPKECEVCGGSGTICYDHDHATGKFRGWLCFNCNLALGYARDNPDILKRLAAYLER